MVGKELGLSALRNEETARVPWVPFVGCHAAKLLGVTAAEYFRSADLVVEGVEEAARRYRADGVPVMVRPANRGGSPGMQAQVGR